MDKIELCSICGNNHRGACSSQLTYFYWHPDHGEKVPTTVVLVGDWHLWQNYEQMSKQIDEKGDIYFQLALSIPVGRYEYKFIVDGEWVFAKDSPTVADPYGSFNNIVEVLPKKALMEYTSRQDIKITSSIAARDLRILGSWDGWKNQIKMQLAYNSLKGCEENFVHLELIPNNTYEFKFKLRNQFLVDEKYPTITNQYGTQNNRIFVYTERMSTPTGWRTSKLFSNSAITCRSFEWERVIVEENYSQYNQIIDGHSMCQIGEFIYIFGGRIRDDFTNKLTKVNIHKLNHMQAEENMPTERAFHCAVSYGRKMLVYGGHNKTILQEYCVFDTTDNVWMPSPEIQGQFPSKRQKQSCVLYEMLLVFFGGYYCSPDFQFQHTFNDIQVLDLEHMMWIQEIKVNGALPESRYSHAASVVNSQMYIFGGITLDTTPGSLSSYINFNDLWVLNLNKVSSLEWERVQTKGKPPMPRHGHTMNALQDFLVIFGGKGDNRKNLNDVIVFDIQKKQWIYPLISSKTSFCEPTPRVFHGSTTVNNQYIVIFGGKTTNNRSTSFYILRPKENKPTLDIEQEDSDQQNQSQNPTRSRRLSSPLKRQSIVD